MSTVKLLQKHKGAKVVLADGTRTTISTVLASSFKLANGTKLKPEQLMATATGFKEKKVAAAKSAPARGKTAATKSAPSAGDYSKTPRKECVTLLVASGKLRVRTDARGKSVDELRAMLSKTKGSAKAAPAPAKTKVAEKPAKTKTKVSSKPEAKRSSPSFQEVRNRIKSAIGTKSTKAKTSTKSETGTNVSQLKPVIKITPKIAKSVEEIVQEKIGSFLQRVTGYDFTVATVGGIHNDTCMTLQIGLMYSNATEEEKEEYADSIHESAEEAASGDDDELGDLNELDDDLDPDPDLDLEEGEDDSDEEEEEDDGLDEEDSDAEEENDEEESEDDETEGEEEFEEEEESEELDEAELLSAATDATGMPVKTLKPFVASWVANFEKIEDALGDEVSVGTAMVSNKSGDTLIVIGFNEDKDKVALFNTVSNKITAAGLAEVAKMEFAADESDDENEEEVDEEDQL